MRAASPGSLRWLLDKQVRWQWAALTDGQRTMWWVILGLVTVVVLVASFSLRGVVGSLRLGGPLPDIALIPVSGALLFLFTLMVSAAITASVEMLFTRGDLDLLLHSPISPGVVLASRALSVALNAALAAVLLVGPLLLLALVLGLWPGLGLLVWWLGAALVSASVGLWLTLGLVRLIGVRRTRTVASVIGALVGAGMFLLFQWRNLTEQSTAEVARNLPSLLPGKGFWPAAEHPVWYAARTAWFEGWPALVLTLLSIGLFALTVLALTRQFTLGVQEVSEKGLVRPQSAGADRPFRFASGRRATLLKEWRLIGRDPELLSRTLLQVLYLLPILFPLSRGGGLRGAVGAGVVLITTNLTVALAHMTLNAEDAPDLLLSAPRPSAALKADKWLAAVLPTLFLGSVGLLLLAWQGTLGGLGGALQVPLLLLGVGGSALMVLWQPLPIRRADLFKKAHNPGLVNTILQLVFQATLAATAFAASLTAKWGWITLVVCLLTLLVSYSLRKSEGE